MKIIGLSLLFSLVFEGVYAGGRRERLLRTLKGSKSSKVPKVGKASKEATKGPKTSKAPKTKCPKAAKGPKGSKAPKRSKGPKGSKESTCGETTLSPTASPTPALSLVPTFISTSVPTTAPTALPTTAAPTLFAGWRSGATNETSCSTICAGAQPFNRAATQAVDSEAIIRYVHETELGLPTGSTTYEDTHGIDCAPLFGPPPYDGLLYTSKGLTAETCFYIAAVGVPFNRICCCANSAAGCPLGD